MPEKQILNNNAFFNKMEAKVSNTIEKFHSYINDSKSKQLLRKQRTEVRKPILFNNSPIFDHKQDAFDFDIKIRSIKQAIDNGANILALIGDYGTGKTSLTKLLYKTFHWKFRNPIYINLWDCVIKDNSTNDSEINYFTKSFLYQLASRNKKVTSYSRYINHRLSKNYGKISLSIPNKSTVIGLFFCLLFVIFFFCFHSASFTVYLNSFLYSSIQYGKYFKIYQTIFLFVSKAPYLLFIPVLIIAFFVLRNDNIIFSLWDSQGKIIPTDTDCFEIFKEIICNIQPRFPFIKNKQLIIIEDLDRSENSEVVCRLLKELYRFINLLPDDQKKKFVFLVSLKSEISLNAKKDNIYTKVFDYSIWIRPIHFNNIREIYYSLLIQKFNRNKTNELLDDFHWLMQGERLTVREIKERLNETFILHQSLVRKNDFSELISYRKCACVVYLQRQYPAEYQVLIKNEKKFADLVNKVFYKTETINTDEVESLFKSPKTGKNNFEYSKEFAKDFVKMVDQKDIDNDYQMFFYNYPRNSYIMNFAEKTIYDYLTQNSYSFDADEEIENYIQICLKTNDAYVVKKAIDELLEYKKDFSEIVFSFKELFLFIYEYIDEMNRQKMLDSYLSIFRESIIKKQSINSLLKILSFSIEAKIENLFLDKSIETLVDLYINNKIDLQYYRELLFKEYPAKIYKFYNLFKNANVKLPLINLKTISLIKETVDLINCLDFSALLPDYDIEYLKAIQRFSFKEYQTQILDCIKLIPNISTNKRLHIEILSLLQKNKIYDEKLFAIIYETYKNNESAKLINYIQCIPNSMLSLKTLTLIDNLHSYDISEIKLVECLENNELYNSALCSRLVLDNFESFDFSSKWLESGLKDISITIYTEHPDLFMKLREKLVIQVQPEIFSILFDAPFSVLTSKELSMMKPYDIYYSVDFSRLNEIDPLIFSNYCNEKNLNGENLFSFFESLFFRDNNNVYRINDINYSKTIISNIDFANCRFSSMDIEQQDKIINVISPLLNLQNLENAMNFISTVKCHIQPLDKFIIDNISSEEDEKKYINICNDISNPTDSVLEYINTVNIKQPLSNLITSRLKKKKMYVPYIIGKTLNDNSFTYDDSIELENYYQAYCQSEKFFQIAKNTKLINYFYENELYDEKLDEKRIKPFYGFSQTFKLIKLTLEKIESNDDKVKYLYGIKEIHSYKECEQMIKLLVKEPYCELFHNNESLKNAIKERLWEFDDYGKDRSRHLKNVFSRAINKRLREKYGSV